MAGALAVGGLWRPLIEVGRYGASGHGHRGGAVTGIGAAHGGGRHGKQHRRVRRHGEGCGRHAACRIRYAHGIVDARAQSGGGAGSLSPARGRRPGEGEGAASPGRGHGGGARAGGGAGFRRHRQVGRDRRRCSDGEGDHRIATCGIGNRDRIIARAQACCIGGALPRAGGGRPQHGEAGQGAAQRGRTDAPAGAVGGCGGQADSEGQRRGQSEVERGIAAAAGHLHAVAARAEARGLRMALPIGRHRRPLVGEAARAAGGRQHYAAVAIARAGRVLHRGVGR